MISKALIILFITIFGLMSCSSLSNLSSFSSSKKVYKSGMASWYGKKYHGRKTASGEIYNMNAMTAAHPKLPFGTKVKVVNQKNRQSVIVRINDRGPFAKGRIIDVSKAAAEKLDMIQKGEILVDLYILK